jgi:hypothetical protein
LDFPFALTVDGAGNLFVANVSTDKKDHLSGAIYKFTPGGMRSTFASGLLADGLAFDSKGNLFVADAGSIYEFTPAGARTTFASGLSGPGDLTCDGADNLFVAASPGHAIYKFTPGGMRSTFAATEGVNRLAFQPAQAAPTPTPTPTPTATPTPSPTPTATPLESVVSLTVSPAKVNKGGSATFTASASPSDPTRDIVVNFSAGGSAVNGTDYTLSANQITIPAGQSSGSVTLQVMTTKTKGTEKAIITLQAETGYTVTTGKKANTAKVTIQNN